MFDKSEEKQDIIKGCLAGMLRELRCPLCLELYKDPVTTPCGHSFCKQCIEKEIFKNSRCPNCRESLNTKQLNTSESLNKIVREFYIVRAEFENLTELNLSQESIINIPQNEQVTSMDTDSCSFKEPSIEASRQYKILQLNDDTYYEIDVPNVSLESKISANMTHLVLKTENYNLVKFNQKYCLGVLYGCYIVNENWLKICIEKKEMIPEDRFEVQGDIDHGRTGAPIKARKNKEMKKHNLFEGVRIGLIDDEEKQYHRYLTVGRGQIDSESNELVVCRKNIGSIDELKKNYVGKTLVSKNWIDDCIAFYEVLKKDKYIYQ